MAALVRMHPEARDAYEEISGQVAVQLDWRGREIFSIDRAQRDLQTIAARANELALQTWERAGEHHGFALANRHECGRYAGRIKAFAGLIQEKRKHLSLFSWCCMKISHFLFGDQAESLFKASQRLDKLFYPDFSLRPAEGLGYVEDETINKVRSLLSSDDDFKKNLFYTSLYKVAKAERGEELPWRWAEVNCQNPREVPQDLLYRSLQTMYLSNPIGNSDLLEFTPLAVS